MVIWAVRSLAGGRMTYHHIQVGVLVDRFIFPEEVWRHDVAETEDDCEHHDRCRVLRRHLDGNALWALTEPPAIAPIDLAVDHKNLFVAGETNTSSSFVVERR